MKAIAYVDPFTYAVDGFKELILKNTGLMAIRIDLAFLTVFSLLSLGLATLLFRRTL
jgi:ABC-2 type transport system permease protein